MAANPTSESELQLYRVLQRANLLQYFETFISQGGDDVQQLCEAGEEEFLEIMALVGMASKPLHVRRLQKVLQEWVTSPAVFHQPLGLHTPPPPIAPGSILASVQRPYLKMNQAGNNTQIPAKTSLANWNPPTETSNDNMHVAGAIGPVPKSISPVSVSVMESGLYSDSVMMGMNGLMNNSVGQQQQMAFPVDSPESGSGNLMDDRASMVSPGATPQLSEGQVAAIEKAAEELAKTLPEYEPKPLNSKKLINKEIEEVMKLPTDHPERMDLLRKYGCIYGRFDSRRKNEKHLSLHEVSVNEASAQLCKQRVSLLTRRDDLFPLARQVVRDSGYQYSKGHSRGQTVEIPPNKKQKLERNMRMAEINRELSSISIHQQKLKRQILQAAAGEENSSEVIMAQNELQSLMARQLQLLSEQGELVRKQRSSRRSQRSPKSAAEGDNESPKEDDQDDDDEDSIPFPTESFSNNGADEDFFDSHSASTTKAMYEEGQHLMQRYAMESYAKGMKMDDREIVIKQEVGAEDIENSLRESGLEPGEVDLSWPSNPSNGNLFEHHLRKQHVGGSGKRKYDDSEKTTETTIATHTNKRKSKEPSKKKISEEPTENSTNEKSSSLLEDIESEKQS